MSKSKEEILWQACTDGDFETVKELADDPIVEVNWGDQEYCRTPFYRACFFGRTSVVEYLMRNPRVDVVKQQSQGATPFFIACQQGHKEVVSLLLAEQRTDPNRQNDIGVTPLFIACQEGHEEVISLLLADPRIDFNTPTNDGATPFFTACSFGHRGIVSAMLADPRIDHSKPKNNQSSPLWVACQHGHLVIVQHLLASKKEIDTRKRSNFNRNTAAEQGRQQPSVPKSLKETEEDFQRRKANGPLCADLIDEYELDPVAVRRRLRRQPGLREHFVGHLFALVVFNSDNFVVINESLAHSDLKRFFKITSRLPLDLQMVLCNRIFGSPRDIILSRDSEPGFKCLARTSAWQE